MRGEMLTNLIDARIGFDELRSRYSFFVITNRNEKPWKALMDAADTFVGKESILSVRYQRFGDDSNIYIMVAAGTDGRTALGLELDRIDDGFVFERKDPLALWESVPWILVQLLINAMGSMSLLGNQFGNMTGRYLCVHQEWLKPKGFKALEFKVQPALDRRLVLDMNVTSFTKADLFGDNPKINRMARYRLDGLRPVRAGAGDEDTYVNKSIWNTRNTIDYLDLHEDKYRHCKVGILCGLLDRFNTLYRGVASLSLVPMAERERVTAPSYTRFTNQLKNILDRRMEDADVVVVDLIQNSDSARCAEAVMDAIRKRFDREVRTSCFPEGSFNICIIHRKEYYEDDPKKDPHCMYEGSWVQHITIEELREKDLSDAVTNVLVKELIIKDDLSKGIISLFDWRSLELDDDIEFIKGISSGDDDETLTIHYLTVHPDGTIEHKSTDAMESMDEVSFLWESGSRSSDPDYVMRDGRGNTCVVRRAPFLPVPDDRIVRKSFGKTGHESPKGNIVKTDGINSLIDLTISELDGTSYYISGYYRYGRYETSQKAPSVRSMETSPGGEYLENLALRLMNVPFVRYNQLTVAPFPIKYLNEAMRSKGVSVEDGNDSD